MSYISGDFWRICDRCGFKKRASQTFKTWDGLYVCSEDFETRHPQDFVRGLRDNQNVPNPRPEPTDALVGPLTTTLSVAAVVGATTLTVASSTRFLTTDIIGIMAGGEMIRRLINDVPSATTITITVGLPAPAAVGSLVVNYSAVSTADIG